MRRPPRIEFPSEPIDGRLWHSHGEYDAGPTYGLHGGMEHPHEGVGHLIDIGLSEGFVYGKTPRGPLPSPEDA